MEIKNPIFFAFLKEEIETKPAGKNSWMNKEYVSEEHPFHASTNITSS